MPIANRARKSRKQKRADLNESILKELLFIAPYIDKTSYFMINSGWLVGMSNNGNYAATKTQLDIKAGPNFENFKAAIEECRDEVAITVLNEKEINIASEDFAININCIDIAAWEKATPPFPLMYRFENSLVFKEALAKALIALKYPNKTHAALSSKVFVDTDCIIGANGHILIAAPTKEKLPGNFWISKQNALTLIATDKELVGIGSDGASGTFYFEDGSFYHFSFAEPYSINLYQPLANVPKLDSDLWVTPPEKMFQIVSDIKKFSNKDKVIFDKDEIFIEDTKAKASFKLDADFEKIGFQIKYILSIEKIALKLLFNDSRIVYFTDGHCVGALMGLDFGKHHDATETKEPIDYDADIPY
jgi:hypothetical protein